MQVVKTYAATPGFEDGVGYQMVEVHQHGRQEDQPVFLPLFRIVEIGNEAYYQEMQGVMDYGL